MREFLCQRLAVSRRHVCLHQFSVAQFSVGILSRVLHWPHFFLVLGSYVVDVYLYAVEFLVIGPHVSTGIVASRTCKFARIRRVSAL